MLPMIVYYHFILILLDSCNISNQTASPLYYIFSYISKLSSLKSQNNFHTCCNILLNDDDIIIENLCIYLFFKKPKLLRVFMSLEAEFSRRGDLSHPHPHRSVVKENGHFLPFYMLH